jgi:hypothetical protein
MEHVSIGVDDLAAAIEFFVELGLEPQGDGTVEGRCVDRVVGLEGVRVDFAMMETPEGNGRLELVKFHSPANEGDKWKRQRLLAQQLCTRHSMTGRAIVGGSRPATSQPAPAAAVGTPTTARMSQSTGT